MYSLPWNVPLPAFEELVEVGIPTAAALAKSWVGNHLPVIDPLGEEVKEVLVLRRGAQSSNQHIATCLPSWHTGHGILPRRGHWHKCRTQPTHVRCLNQGYAERQFSDSRHCSHSQVPPQHHKGALCPQDKVRVALAA